MDSSSSSSSSRQSNQTLHHFGEFISIPNCSCGQVLNLKTSWTNENPGRRYWECQNSNGNVRAGCGFIKWFDPPMCSRSKKIIPRLLRRINRSEEEIDTLRMKIRAVGKTGMKSGKSSVNLKLIIKVVFIWTIILVLAMCYFCCCFSSCEARVNGVKMLPW